MSENPDDYKENKSIAMFSRDHDGELFEIEAGRLDHDQYDDLLEWSRTKKISDITFESGQFVFAKIGKGLHRMTSKRISHTEIQDVLRAMYGDNGPGLVNAGADLDFAYEVRRPSGRMRFRVNTTCSRMGNGGRGAQITLRTLPVQPPLVKDLGTEQEILDNIRPPQGLNIFAGPTNSGKSTLMSALVRWHCEKETSHEKIIEYSRPIEYVYDGLDFPHSFVVQHEVGDHIRPTDDALAESGGLWPHCVRNALRRGPDIIMLGESRDRATIRGCIDAALTGHLVMSTMHTIGVPETMQRAMVAFPADERRSVASDLLECINLVCTQMLLPAVRGGRVGCREFMVFDRKTKAALVAIDPEEWPSRLREMLASRRVVGRSMADSARALLRNGDISPETFEWISSRSSSDSKVVRQALGERLYE